MRQCRLNFRRIFLGNFFRQFFWIGVIISKLTSQINEHVLFREWRTSFFEAVIIVSISSCVSFPKRIHAIFCITLRNLETPTNFSSTISCLAVCRLLLLILCFHNAMLSIEKCFKILSLQCKSCEQKKNSWRIWFNRNRFAESKEKKQ